MRTVPVGDGRRPSLALIFAITLTGILGNTLINAAIPDILDDLGVSDGGAGLLVAAAALPGIAMAPLIGVLADRYGRRAVLLPCLVVFGACGGLAALAPSFPWLLAARFGQGFGAAGLINLANILIGDHWSGVARARIYGFNSAVLTIGIAVLPFAGGVLTDLGGWRFSFAPYPVALLVAVVIGRRLGPGPQDRSVSLTAQLRSAGALLRRPALLVPISLALVTFLLIFGLFLTVLPVHLEREFGLGASARGAVVAAPALGATLASLLLGRLRRRLAVRTLLVVAFTAFALAFPVVGRTGALAVLVGAAFAYGIGEGLIIPTLTDVVASGAPDSARGSILSVQVGAVRAGQSVGPLAAGAGVGLLGTGGTFVAGGAVALVVVAAVLVAPLAATPAD